MPRRIPKNLPTGKRFTVERGLWCRKRSDGSLVWGITYQTPVGTRWETVGEFKTIARDALASRKADVARGKYDFTKPTDYPLFASFVDTYVDHAKQHKRSWKRDEQTLKACAEFFKYKRLNEITGWDVERWKAPRREAVKPATVNRDLAVLKRLFNLAIEWVDLPGNPVAGVRFFKVDERPIRVLTVDEENKLCDAAAPHLCALIRVAVNTGLRRGELFNLQWEAVDLTQRSLTVEHSKSGRVRHVTINKKAVESLRSLPEPHDTGAVFKFRGNHLTDIKKAFAGALKRSKIVRCRFHDLRHTYATRLVLAGVDLPTVKELLGHASITTTMQYAHPGPPHKRAAVDWLDALYEAETADEENKT